MRRYLVPIVLVAISVIVMLAVIDFGEVIRLLREADWRLILLAMVFLLLSYVLISVRWRYLLRNETGFMETFHIAGSGFMLGILMQLPNSAYRIVAVDQATPVETSHATSSTVVDVLTGHISRILALVVAFVFLASRLRGSETSILVSVGVIVLIVGGLFLLVTKAETIKPWFARTLHRIPRVDEDRANNVSETVVGSMAKVGSPKRLIAALLISLAAWISALMFYDLILEAFQLELDRPNLLVALVALVVVPPAAPYMAGIFHGLLIGGLVALKLMDAETATAYAVLLHAIQLVVLLIIGAWGLSQLGLNLGELLSRMRSRRKDEPTPKAVKPDMS